MKHTIRQHGQLTQIDCELGSGMVDKNGREIIEGDIVNVPDINEICPVKRILDGAFVFVDSQGRWYFLFRWCNDIEVVGHVEDEQ